jgi:cellulose synthase/poly-beta-1,6-N-acetylglucosamine synthase-like glycosyltransferase
VSSGMTATWPMTSTPDSATLLSVTVVVPTRDRGDMIRETVERLMTLSYPVMEIVVADQSSDEATTRMVDEVARGDTRVRVHRTGTRGLGVNRNVGLAVSGTDIVAYTDDDCIVADGWVEAIVAEFTNNPEVAAVFGRLLPYERTDRTGTETGFKPETQRVEYSELTPPWWIGHGGNMAFRRAALVEVGGFDPMLGAGAPLRSGEDADIIYRLLRSGRRIVYSPDALAYHKHWKDWRAQRSMERCYGIGVGAQLTKYMRCGDVRGASLLASWIWQLGVRRVGAGLLKWRNPKVVYLGYCQLVYPLLGVVRSLRFGIERDRLLYRG